MDIGWLENEIRHDHPGEGGRAVLWGEWALFPAYENFATSNDV